MKITKIEASNDCGGFQPPKGHLDTQLFPECKGCETDRDVVKKTVERRKKNKKKKKKASVEESPCGSGCKTCSITEGKKEKKKKEEEYEYNPWAVCTKSVGREDKEKYERCVQKVKKQQEASFNLAKFMK